MKLGHDGRHAYHNMGFYAQNSERFHRFYNWLILLKSSKIKKARANITISMKSRLMTLYAKNGGTS